MLLRYQYDLETHIDITQQLGSDSIVCYFSFSISEESKLKALPSIAAIPVGSGAHEKNSANVNMDINNLIMRYVIVLFVFFS